MPAAKKTKPTPAPPASAETLALVPLSDCYIHPLNNRSEPPDADIAALADSIAALGLLQNLAGWIEPSDAADLNQKIGIVAGGRRLRALRLLAERDGHDPAMVTIPVKLAPDQDTARLWASAENTARHALSPADEVRAYGRMMAGGAQPDTIARAFAVTERHVRQRLKLATLPEAVLDCLKRGQITLDQAAAMTMGRTPEAILAVLDTCLTSRWHTNTSEIRRKLQESSISTDDPRARLVGLLAYRAAGGRLIEDLFTDNALLLDEDILNDLVAERMAEEAAQRRATGWGAVEIGLPVSNVWETPKGMIAIHRTPVDLPDADQAELDRLAEMGSEQELTEAQIARMTELEQRQIGDYADDDIAASTIWLHLDRKGQIAIFGPFRPRAGINAGEGGPDDTGTTLKPEGRGIPQNLLDDLGRIRLAALQHRAAQQYDLMLDLLAFQIDHGAPGYWSTLDVTLTRQTVTPEKASSFTPPACLQDAERGLAEKLTAANFAAFRAKGEAHRDEVLRRALARSIRPGIAAHLAADLAPNPREIWTPDFDNYFNRVPGPVLDSIWQELVPEDLGPAPATFRARKKADKARELDRLFNSPDYREALGLSRGLCAQIDTWLPPEMHWPTEGDAA